MNRAVLAVGLAVTLMPSVAWAACETDSPLFTTAGSHELSKLPTSFVVAARDKVPGCQPSEFLTMSATGLPSGVRTMVDSRTPGETSMSVYADFLQIGAPWGTTYNVTYTVTDRVNNTTSVSLPLKIGSTNTAPTLDPISDLIVPIGQSFSFMIGLSDPDKDLLLSSQTLVIDGLPPGAMKQLVQYNSERMACRITLKPTSSYYRGTYRVNIQGKDSRGGYAIAQMRITIP